MKLLKTRQSARIAGLHRSVAERELVQDFPSIKNLPVEFRKPGGVRRFIPLGSDDVDLSLDERLGLEAIQEVDPRGESLLAR
jgi:hypothetical protein